MNRERFLKKIAHFDENYNEIINKGEPIPKIYIPKGLGGIGGGEYVEIGRTPYGHHHNHIDCTNLYLDF